MYYGNEMYDYEVLFNVKVETQGQHIFPSITSGIFMN